MHDDIIRVAQSLGVDISALTHASDQSRKVLEKFRRELSQKFPLSSNAEPSDIDLVVHGSYAREEATSESDFDHLIVLHGLPKPRFIQDFIKEVERIRIEETIKEPGREGLFGEIVVAGELFTRIGLESDTNATTTRRMLLLTESVSAYDDRVHKTVLTATLDRYCFDHEGQNQDNNPSRIPRFLLNDLIRYWRTITVDFGAKRWRLLGKGWHLRLAKLRTSRKLMIAGSLASVFQTPRKVNDDQKLAAYLFEQFRKPALARLACTFDLLGEKAKSSLKEILITYNRFIEITGKKENRELLEDEKSKEGEKLRKELHAISESVQQGLEEIFYLDPLFSNVTKNYGLF